MLRTEGTRRGERVARAACMSVSQYYCVEMRHVLVHYLHCGFTDLNSAVHFGLMYIYCRRCGFVLCFTVARVSQRLLHAQVLHFTTEDKTFPPPPLPLPPANR